MEEEKEKFNQAKYTDDFNKKNYARLNTRLKHNEFVKLQKIMKERKINSYRKFILIAMELIEKKQS